MGADGGGTVVVLRGRGREVLGLAVGDSEEETFWRAFLTDLKTRGLSGVRLVISDQHAGLIAALRRCFQGARARKRRSPSRSTAGSGVDRFSAVSSTITNPQPETAGQAP
jgi:putative transposase